MVIHQIKFSIIGYCDYVPFWILRDQYHMGSRTVKWALVIASFGCKTHHCFGRGIGRHRCILLQVKHNEGVREVPDRWTAVTRFLTILGYGDCMMAQGG